MTLAEMCMIFTLIMLAARRQLQMIDVPEVDLLCAAKHAVIQEEIDWLQQLQILNSGSKVRFIQGSIQSLRAIRELNTMLAAEGVSYLHTRFICQDPLEQFYGKCRTLKKYPTAHDFYHIYSKCSISSLLLAPKHGNCELTYENFHQEYTFEDFELPPDHGFSMSSLNVREIIQKPQQTEFCKVNESIITLNSATYFIGYLFYKMKNSHQVSTGRAFKECSVCAKLVVDPTIEDHQFAMYKDYSSWDRKNKLNYVNPKFVQQCMRFNRLFLYCLKTFKRSEKFVASLVEISIVNFPNLYFCTLDVFKRFLKKFYISRVFHCLKAFDNHHFGIKTIASNKTTPKEEKRKKVSHD